jgi:hypothetical protein
MQLARSTYPYNLIRADDGDAVALSPTFDRELVRQDSARLRMKINLADSSLEALLELVQRVSLQTPVTITPDTTLPLTTKLEQQVVLIPTPSGTTAYLIQDKRERDAAKTHENIQNAVMLRFNTQKRPMHLESEGESARGSCSKAAGAAHCSPARSRRRRIRALCAHPRLCSLQNRWHSQGRNLSRKCRCRSFALPLRN